MRSYSIGEISEMFDLPISTLRYYDKEGLFPDLARYGTRRLFTKREIEALHIIECLKTSGLEIKDIKQFMQWCCEGPSMYPQCQKLLEERCDALEKEINQLQKTLDFLNHKCRYYETAMKEGGEEDIQ